MKDTVFYSKKTLNIRGRLMDVSTPWIMGIMNVTPDSFYENSRVSNEHAVVEKAEQLLSEGATILDLGGYSSRPGAVHISEEEELQRVIPALRSILKTYPSSIISVDTFRANVARQAWLEGASMVNDISGGSLDEHMYDVIAEYNIPYILMHMKGTPQTMVHENQYDHLMEDLINYFVEKVALLRKKGIKDIIIDPGFGFSKNIDQNFMLLKNFNMLKILNLPILAGLSRKSMIYKTLKVPVSQAMNGSVILQTIALLQGASIVRVHDVKETREAIELLSCLDTF